MSLCSNSGKKRATKNTPAVTIVAEWISADTRSGLPSHRATTNGTGTAPIADGSQQEPESDPRCD